MLIVDEAFWVVHMKCMWIIPLNKHLIGNKVLIMFLFISIYNFTADNDWVVGRMSLPIDSYSYIFISLSLYKWYKQGLNLMLFCRFVPHYLMFTYYSFFWVKTDRVIFIWLFSWSLLTLKNLVKCYWTTHNSLGLKIQTQPLNIAHLMMSLAWGSLKTLCSLESNVFNFFLF